MNQSEPDLQQNAETLEHLLEVVIENRDKRCLEIRENALLQVKETIRRAHKRSHKRFHRHADSLREKYRLSVTSAQARNQTQLRQQRHEIDRGLIDAAWPLLNDAMLALWNETKSRQVWLDSATALAVSLLLEHQWQIEHPLDFSEENANSLRKELTDKIGKAPVMLACEDIQAGVRIIAHGTVVDATGKGLLQHKSSIEAILLARIKQAISSHG
jgi:hypothetical protein